MLNIHDSIVTSYEVNLQNQKIILYAQNKNATGIETIEIIFSDVLAHFFENVIPGSVVFEINKDEVHKFIEENQNLLEKGKAYCWPADFDTLNELQAMLLEKRYLYYRISSSYGLSGWVLAKKYETRILM